MQKSKINDEQIRKQFTKVYIVPGVGYCGPGHAMAERIYWRREKQEEGDNE